MAGYVLGLGQAIKESDGQAALKARIRLAAEKSGEQKAGDLMSVPPAERHQALAERLQNMLHDFGGTHVPISAKGTERTIDNPTCPCLPPFVGQASRFGFGPDEVRRYACMICMPAYAKAAKLLGLQFKGTLSENGCVMSFCKETILPTTETNQRDPNEPGRS